MILMLLIFHFISVIVSSPLHHDEIKSKEKDTVVVLAFSGLRWDSLNKFDLSSFRYMEENGVYAQRKIDPFQTETLPSFVSMVTGEYPEIHGIISNKMVDSKTHDRFNADNEELKWWKDVKPIWVKNRENGNNSALCYWPGANVRFNSTKLNFTCEDKKYVDPFKEVTLNGYTKANVMPFHERIQKVKSWLDNKDKNKPNFIGVYFEEPLKTIMKYGIGSNETKEIFEKINNITYDLMDHLNNNKHHEHVNLIVTGESGVTELDADKQIYLEDYLLANQTGTYDIIDDGPIMTIHPKNKKAEHDLYKRWKNAHIGMQIYIKETLNDEFHYFYQYRTCPIIIVAKEHWRVYPKRVVDSKKALMGYDGEFGTTHSLFLGYGRKFKRHVYEAALGNIDIFYILCDILSIETKYSKNKNLKLLENIMVAQPKWYSDIVEKVTKNTLSLTIAIVVSMILLFIAIYLIVASLFKCVNMCNWHGQAVTLKVSPNKKLNKKRVETSGQHLLSEEEISSEESDTDNEFTRNRR